MSEQPSRFSSIIFLAKASILQMRRAVQDAANPALKRHVKLDPASEWYAIGESSTALWSDDDPAERLNQCGKVQNLRVAARQLDGVEVSAGEVFSFWKQLGKTTSGKGYAAGRELREGCLIPTIGGGLCQLSNALYESALQAGFEILERHVHSENIPGSAAARGRDATVFWNYVDLRFRSHADFRIEAKLTRDDLVVRFLSSQPEKTLTVTAIGMDVQSDAHSPDSCMSCGVLSCFRFQELQKRRVPAGRKAYLVDEFWPEFDEYLNGTKGEEDVLLLPLDGSKFRKANYAWTVSSFGTIKSFTLFTLCRAIESRRLAAQGAARQLALQKHQAKLADLYAGSIPHDVTHVVVSQGLLPYLWMNGALGGRTFDVLMTSLPMEEIQRQLDYALSLHPGSSTLGDFRAAAKIIKAESEALQAASKVISPHTEVSKLFASKVELLSWRLPSGVIAYEKTGSRIVFPASALGRKGAYEVRAAAERLGLPVAVCGSDLEYPEFWQGIRVERVAAGDWLQDAAVVVLPSFVENQPRRLLQAIAAGVPVIASSACGITGLPGVHVVSAGNIDEILNAIVKLARKKSSGGVSARTR